MADTGHTIGTAWVQVALSTKAISQQLKEALGDVDTKPAERRITSGLGGAFKQVGKIAAGALAVAGTVGLATSFADVASQAINASDATNKFKNTLSFAGKSTDDINRLTKSTKDYADKTVYGLSDIQSITAQLASNNVEGYDKLAEAAGNLNAVAGGNAETFKSVGMVLTQTAGQGKLTTENWNQLADAIPGASGKLQEALLKAGAYTGNFREAMEKGEITAEEFNAAVMELGMTDVAREAATSTATIEGAWGNLEAALVSGGMSIVDKIKPALTSFMGTVATGAEKAFSWINDTLIPGIQGVWDILSKGQFDGSSKLFGLDEDSRIVDFLFRIGDGARAAGEWITGTLVPSVRSLGEIILTGDTDKPLFGLDPSSPIVGFLESLRDAALKVVDAGVGLIDWATRNKDLISTLAVTVGTATIAFKSMQTVTKTMTAINTAGSIMKWVTSLDMMKNAVNAAKAAQAAFNVVMNANPIMLVVTAIAALVAGLIWFFTQTETGKRAWAAITEAFRGFLDWIAPYWDATLAALSAAWDAVWGAVSGFFTSYVVPAISGGVSALGGLWDGLVAIVSAVWTGIQTVVMTVVAWFQAYVVPAVSGAVSILSGIWDGLVTVVSTVWTGIQTAVMTVVGWFQAYVVPVFEAVWTGIKIGLFALSIPFIVVWTLIKTAVQLVVDWFSTYIVPTLSAVWSMIVTGAQMLWSGVKAVWDGIMLAVQIVVAWFQTYVAPILSAVWTGIVTGAQMLWTGIQAVWNGIMTAVQIVVAWFQTYVQSALSAVWTGIKFGADLLWTGIQTVWAGIQVAVQIVVAWFQAYVAPVLSAVWTGIQTGAQFLWSTLQAVWTGIQVAVLTVVAWFQTYVQPVLTTVWTAIQNGAQTLWTGIQTVWNGIQTAVLTVVSWFQTYVQPVISAVWSGIKSGADTLWTGLQTVWNGIKTTIDTVTNWFRDTIKPIFDTVTDNIKTAFTNMKTGIQTVWDGVKSVAAKPINFIINTVYRDGIKKTADAIAEKLGLSLRLPDVSGIPGYASGGVLPGYSPGRDIYHFFSPDGGGALALSGGEAIMRPEWVRAVGGRRAINAMNAAARGSSGGHIPGGDRGARFAAFADGGIWDSIKSTVSSGIHAVGEWISTATEAASSIISDPLGAVENLIRIPVNALMNSLPGSGFFKDMAAALPDKWIDGFGEWLKGNTSAMPVTGSATDIVNAARLAIGATYVWGGSTIPPGVDCSGLVYWAAHQMGSQIPRLTAAGYQAGSTPGGSYNTPGTLLFWGYPAHHIAIASGNGMMVEAPTFGIPVRETPIYGGPSTGLYKFDSGGILQPGLTSVLNASGKPEAVFTNDQWDKLDRLISGLENGRLWPKELVVRDVDRSLVGRMRVEADSAVDRAARDLAGRRRGGVR